MGQLHSGASSKDIFISHSSLDKKIAEALADLLRVALNISANRIVCTSVDGYKLRTGAVISDQLRQEVRDTKAFICLITKESIKSDYVLFELGARWGAGLHLAPLLASGTNPAVLRGPLSQFHALTCDNPADVHQLVSDIAQELNIIPGNVSSYQKYVDALVLQSKRSKKRTEQQIKDELPETSSKVSRKPENMKYYFLTGCGVGNNLALLPIPPDPHNSMRELDEFLGYLKEIGIQDKSTISPFLDVRNKFTGPAAANIKGDETRIIIEQFFAAMSSLPDVVQNRSSAEGYQWFKFGQLIYKIGTLAVVDSEDNKSIISSIVALESLIERMNLPSNLNQEIAKFIQSAKSKKTKNQAYEGANRIALAVFSMF